MQRCSQFFASDVFRWQCNLDGVTYNTILVMPSEEVPMASATLTETRCLGPDDAGELVSAEEFATLEFVAPFRYERVKGRLVVMAPAGSDHRGTSRGFRLELGTYWGAHRDLIDDVDVEGW